MQVYSPAMFYGVFGCQCEYCNSVKQAELKKAKAFLPAQWF